MEHLTIGKRFVVAQQLLIDNKLQAKMMLFMRRRAKDVCIEAPS
ncbi:MAG TPA: hypothetical protein VJJ26_03270 [Candidatus Babeliales bacterium]|nr:hypothetical protein [Candidatus Babeliales bacterium]